MPSVFAPPETVSPGSASHGKRKRQPGYGGRSSPQRRVGLLTGPTPLLWQHAWTRSDDTNGDGDLDGDSATGSASEATRLRLTLPSTPSAFGRTTENTGSVLNIDDDGGAGDAAGSSDSGAIVRWSMDETLVFLKALDQVACG